MNRIWTIALAALAVIAAQPAQADGWGWHRPWGGGWGWHEPDWGGGWGWHRPYYWGGPSVVFAYPPPVAYAPPPVAYAPPPAAYATQPPPLQATPASPPYTDSSGRYCREYQSTVMVGGQPQQSYGTACRQPDGTWRVVN